MLRNATLLSNKVIFVFFISVSLLAFTNFQYHKTYLFHENLLLSYLALAALTIVSVIQFSKEFTALSAATLLLLYILAPLGNEYGSYTFLSSYFAFKTVSVLTHKHIPSFLKKLPSLEQIFIFSFYVGVVVFRIEDEYWREGQGAIITLSLPMLDGLISLKEVSSSGVAAKILNYTSHLSEILVGSFVLLKRTRLISFCLGLILHLTLLFLSGPIMWHLPLVFFYAALAIEEKNSSHNKTRKYAT